MHTLATLIVFADLQGNSNNIKNVVVSFSVAAIIGFLAFSVLRSDHRGAWMAVPLVALILILATQGGLTAVRSGGMLVWNMIFG
jgi:hypothetical protein